MNNIMTRIGSRNILRALLFIAPLIFFACSNDKSGSKDEKAIDEKVSESNIEIVIDRETELLLKDLEENGDYVNSREFPSLIKASSVNEDASINTHIIDIRNPEDFTRGRLPGSVNVKFQDLPSYLVTDIKPFEFDRIVLVSNDGQLASYTSSLLRLMGYGNVYALRWGMSGWNMSFAESGWLAGCSSAFQENLETEDSEKPSASGMPLLNTGYSTGEEIGGERFKKLFSEGLEEVMISPEEVFNNPEKYFVINYDRRDKYESGHIPGAVRYKPGATLGIVSEMATIPSDLTVVVYCGTGHNSGFVTAFLRLFGYDARTLSYGNNGFMYEKMKAERATLSWLPFTDEYIEDFEIEN